MYNLVSTPYIKHSTVVAQFFKVILNSKRTILYDYTDYYETVILGVIPKFLFYLSKLNNV